MELPIESLPLHALQLILTRAPKTAVLGVMQQNGIPVDMAEINAWENGKRYPNREASIILIQNGHDFLKLLKAPK